MSRVARISSPSWCRGTPPGSTTRGSDHPRGQAETPVRASAGRAGTDEAHQRRTLMRRTSCYLRGRDEETLGVQRAAILEFFGRDGRDPVDAAWYDEDGSTRLASF